MIHVKSHTRKRRNGVSVIRKHFRNGQKKVRDHFNPNRFDYDESSRELVIKFPFGAKYRYIDVPPSIQKRIDADPKAALAYIKKTFTYAPENAKAQSSFKNAEKNRAKKAKAMAKK